MINLNDVFPPALAKERNRNAILSEKHNEMIENLLEDIHSGSNWQYCIQILATIKKERAASRSVVDKDGKPLRDLATPVKFMQILYYITYKFNVKQSDITAEFERNGVIINNKLFQGESSISDFKKLVEYTQPKMHIYYKGQKNRDLAVAIKNLVFQSGNHGYYVDIFGGSGAGTLAVPRRNNTKYVYNDLDTGLVCLYKTLSDKILSKKLIEYLKDLQNDLKCIVNDGETTSACDLAFNIEFEYEIDKFIERILDKKLSEASDKHFVDGINYDRVEEISKINPTLEDIQDWSYKDTELMFNDRGILRSAFDYVLYLYNHVVNINTDESQSFMKNFLLDDDGNLNNYDAMMCLTRNRREVNKFAKSNGLHTLNNYERDKNGNLKPLNYYELRSEQYRYFQWYAFFDNILNNDIEVKDVYNTNSDDIVLIALAEIFMWSVLYRGDKSRSPIDAIFKKDSSTNEIKHKEFHTNFIKKQFDILINDITKYLSDGKTLIENEDCVDIINAYANNMYTKNLINNKTKQCRIKTLYYVDSPYIQTSSYTIGKWSGDDSKRLIDSLITTCKETYENHNHKFIFSCRACAKTTDKVDAVRKNKDIYDSVLLYFSQQQIPLWVTYISSQNKMPLECAIANNKQAEIMITNYEVQSFGSKDKFRVMPYEEFMSIVVKHLNM